MKKILIVSPHMIRGGVERSLVNIALLLRDKYDVDIMLIKARGDLLNELPADLYKGELPLNNQAREEAYRSYGKKIAIKKDIKLGHFCSAIRRLTSKDPYVYLTNGWNDIEVLPQKYDIAICFHMHHSFLIGYVAKKVNADRKILWIRSDLNTSGFAMEKYREYLKEYQTMVCISKRLRDEVIEHIPYYSDRVYVFYNIQNVKYITDMANLHEEDNFGQDDILKLLTVARLEKEKGIDIAIRIAVLLKKSGVKFKWLVLGEGSEHDRLCSMIASNNIVEEFCLLGNKTNPYPYMKQCDIYIQPSRHEGWCNTVSEALCLKKIVIATDFAGAREQIENGKNGIVVPQKDEEALYKNILYVMENETFRNKIHANLENSSIICGIPDDLCNLLEGK